jgi:hypothetical protein
MTLTNSDQLRLQPGRPNPEEEKINGLALPETWGTTAGSYSALFPNERDERTYPTVKDDKEVEIDR